MAIIDRPRIAEDYQLPEKAPEQRRLKTPEVSLNADINAALYHPDEAFVSFHPSEKTAVQEAIEEGMEQGAFHLSEDQRNAYAMNPPMVNRHGESTPYAQAMQDTLDGKLEALKQEEKEQRVRLQHFKEERADLWQYATHRNVQPSPEVLSNSAIYLYEVLKGLQSTYADRNVTKNNPQTGRTVEHFAMLATEKPAVTSDNAKLGTKPVSPKLSMQPVGEESTPAILLDTEVMLKYDDKSQLESYQVTTDLNGKLDYQVSLVLGPGAGELRVMKHNYDRTKQVEVTDDIRKSAFTQAVIANLYHRVSGRSPANDETAKALTAISAGRKR